MKSVEASAKHNIFITCTQHHICLSLAIIEQEKLKNSLIIFFSSRSLISSDPFFNEIEQLKKELKFEIAYVQGSAGKFLPLKMLKRWLSYRKTYKNISTSLSAYVGKKRFYIFNDNRQETQFIINKYKVSTAELNEFYLVQDGIAQYIKHYMKPRPWHKILYYKILFGFFWKSLPQLGEYVLYDGIYSLFPEGLMPRYKKYKNSEPILPDCFYSTCWRRVSTHLMKEIFPQFFEMKEDSVIVFLPFFRDKKTLKSAEQEILSLLQKDKYKKIYLKYHPRTPYKMNLKSNNELFFDEVPPGIPAESFFAFNKESSVNYYISLSTVALLAAVNNPKREQVKVIMKDSLSSLNQRIQSNESFYNFLNERLVY